MHFVKERTNVKANCYTNDLLKDCHYLLENNFVFQRKGAQAREAKVTRDYYGSEITARASLRRKGLVTVKQS